MPIVGLHSTQGQTHRHMHEPPHTHSHERTRKHTLMRCCFVDWGSCCRLSHLSATSCQARPAASCTGAVNTRFQPHLPNPLDFCAPFPSQTKHSHVCLLPTSPLLRLWGCYFQLGNSLERTLANRPSVQELQNSNILKGVCLFVTAHACIRSTPLPSRHEEKLF